jgi:hypothetical protein
MDIRKPKPIHSWREFLSELGVVVLGIALAFSGEQLIEHLHDEHKAEGARRGIREEIGTNLGVLGNRAEIQACIDRRLDEIATLLNMPDAAYVAPSSLGRPQIWEMQQSRWQVATLAGRAPLLDANELAGYGFIYALFADIAVDEDREQTSWTRLRALEGLTHPTPQMRDTLRLSLQDARYANFDIKGLFHLIEQQSSAMSINKLPPDRVMVDKAICSATTYGDGQAQS